MTDGKISVRAKVCPSDLEAVCRIVASSSLFNSDEVAQAAELIEDRLGRGERSTFHFLFAEAGNRTVGYSCFGPVAGSRESFDSHWIAVEAGKWGKGVGRALLAATEEAIHSRGGRRIYVEISSREAFSASHAFYRRHGFVEEARLKDCFAPGEDKAILVKVLGGSSPIAAAQP